MNWPAAAAGTATSVITDRDIRTPPRALPPEVAAVAPRFNGTGEAKPRVLESLAADLAALRAADALARDRSMELDVVALEGYADAQRAMHVFSNELPPRSSLRGEALRAYVEQLDKGLAALAAAHPEHLLVVVAPAGVVPPGVPSNAYSLARDAVAAEDPGADDGFVLVTGPGAAHKENPPSAFVVDVVPSVLFAAGLPVGRDMDGRVLTDAFDEELLRRTTLSVIQTYEAERMVVRRGGS